MLKFIKKIAVVAMAAAVAAPALLVSAAPPREGDVDVSVEPGSVKVNVQRDEDAATRAVVEGRKMGAFRSSDLMSMDVENAEGKDLGAIEDIVIATNDGKVRYAALSFGGFLGLGDKMFAIPWNALEMKRTDDSTHFVLNVSQEKLENAPGFDQDNWPNFADPSLTGKLDAYYGTNDKEAAVKKTDRSDDANRANRDATNISPHATAYRVSEVKALEVHDANGKNIASIEDVVIDIDEGNVRYVAISFDDSWGYGEKLFAMPWKALKFQSQDDETAVVLNVTQAQMKSATGFDNDDWPNFADPEWRKTTDDFYLNVPGAEVKVE